MVPYIASVTRVRLVMKDPCIEEDIKLRQLVHYRSMSDSVPVIPSPCTYGTVIIATVKSVFVINPKKITT